MTTYKLPKPIIHNNTTYSQLTFRESTLGDLMVIDAFTGAVGKTVALLAQLSDTPIQVIKQIPTSELSRLEKIAEGELGEPVDTAPVTGV